MKQQQKSQSGFAHIGLLLLALAVLAVIGFVGFRVFQKKSSSTPTGSGPNASGSTGWQKDCKGDNRVPMTHSPMNLEDVGSITPVGLTAGAHVTPIDHLYFYPKDGPRDKYPVYAMADGYIISIGTRSVNVSSGEARPTEYRIVFQHSCQTISYFDLVTKLDKSITDKYPDAATKGTDQRIAVKAGQEIGRIGAQTLDTAIYNMDLTLPGFIHPAMYEAEPWKVHTDQFFTYFSEPLLSQMLAKNPRKAEPRSGKIDYDQPGKLIGNWFKEGTNGYAGPKGSSTNGVGSNNQGPWSTHLAIFYNAYDPSLINISIGSFKTQPQAFDVTGNKPDPATVSAASGVVKYELIQQSIMGASPTGQINRSNNGMVMGTILFQVMDGEKLKVEIFPDMKASSVSGFTSAAVMYER